MIDKPCMRITSRFTDNNKGCYCTSSIYAGAVVDFNRGWHFAVKSRSWKAPCMTSYYDYWFRTQQETRVDIRKKKQCTVGGLYISLYILIIKSHLNNLTIAAVDSYTSGFNCKAGPGCQEFSFWKFSRKFPKIPLLVSKRTVLNFCRHKILITISFTILKTQKSIMNTNHHRHIFKSNKFYFNRFMGFDSVGGRNSPFSNDYSP